MWGLFRDQLIGGPQDALRRTVILFELDDFQRRKIVMQAFQVFPGAHRARRISTGRHRRPRSTFAGRRRAAVSIRTGWCWCPGIRRPAGIRRAPASARHSRKTVFWRAGKSRKVVFGGPARAPFPQNRVPARRQVPQTPFFVSGTPTIPANRTVPQKACFCNFSTLANPKPKPTPTPHPFLDILKAATAYMSESVNYPHNSRATSGNELADFVNHCVHVGLANAGLA